MADDKFDQLLKDLKAAQPAASPADGLRREAFDRTPALLSQGNCIRCHDRGPGLGRPIDQDLRLLDFNKPLGIKGFDAPPAKPLDAAAMERQVVEKFKTQPIIDQSVTILNRMPDKVAITVDKDRIAIATDFVKALEAIPGVKLNDEAKDHLSKVKSIGFEKGVYHIQLDKKINFADGLGTLGPDLSFEVKNDTTKADGVGIKNIKGLNILGMAVEELSVRTDGGKNAITAKCDFFGKKVEQSIDLNKYGLHGDLLKQAIGQLSEYQPMFQNRDFGKFTDQIPEGFRTTVSDMLSGVTSVTKDGDTFAVKRNNGSAKFELNGMNATIGSDVSFKLGKNADEPAIRDLRGVSVSIPIPGKLSEYLGDSYNSQIRGVSLGSSERDGGRRIRVDAEGTVDQVGVSLTKDFKPRADGAGNWNLNLRGNNPLSPDGRKDRMDINLRVGADGKLNMKLSEALDIVSNLSWQATDRSLDGVSMGASSVYSRVASWVSYLFE